IPKGYKTLSSTEDILIFNKLSNALYVSVDYIDNKLLGKQIFIFTKSKEITMKISIKNIPHLYGLYYGYGSRRFWSDLKKRRLDLKKLFIKKDGTTFQKISAMQSIQHLFENESRLIGSGIYERMSFDSAIRTNKLILLIGLVYSENGNFVPNTVLDIKRKKIDTGEDIIKIYTRDIKTGEISFLKNFE
ncbi:MAG: hypothetical protein LBV67_06755, partial [Streptococcaceae bacterium]|nr:hypothetical protein [Streptococcaceae bacterium]